jgi:ParB family transcriptional regulator, chromosome partitioning protein
MEDHSFDGAVAEHADALDSQAAFLETSLGRDAKVEYVALSRLTTSPLNVRRKAPTGIEGLAESISAKGLLQNLVAHTLKGKRGKHAPLGVCAGQRRLAALQMLADDGRIHGTYLVPVKVVSEAEALAASLIENESREPMHAADLAVAFLLLTEEGRTADYISALFSVPVLTVQRRLKIANVSPKLLDVYRNDGMSTEQVNALALTDDHATQERLWFDAAQSWLRHPNHLRAAITSDEIDVRNNPLVSFVTLDAYEAAGGYVRRDLFSDKQNAGYIGDAALLQRLATERLMVLAQDVAAEGWQFVETRVKRDHSELSAYGRLSSHSRDMTKKEEREFAKLIKARDKAAEALNAYYDDESEAEDDDKRDALEEAANATSAACDQYVERLESWTPEQMASAGAFLMLDHAGQVVIERGLVKPEDRAAAQRSGIEGSASFTPEKKAKPVHSEKLCRRLTAHRTAAVQVALAANPNVALAVLMNRLIPTVFNEHFRRDYSNDRNAIEVSAICSHGKLLREADDMAASTAWTTIDAERSKWAAMLPKHTAHLLPWLLEQSDDVKANLFAFCVAATLDSVSGTDSAHPINTLCDVLEVDMAKYWTPTRETYLNHVSKARIVEVVSNAVSPEAAAPLASMKKDEAAAAAEIRLSESGWIPEVLTNRETAMVYSDEIEDADVISAEEETSEA